MVFYEINFATLVLILDKVGFNMMDLLIVFIHLNMISYTLWHIKSIMVLIY